MGHPREEPGRGPWFPPFAENAKDGAPSGLQAPGEIKDPADHLLRWLLQFSDPDVAEAEWGAGVAVGLEFDWRRFVLFVEGLADVEGFAF